MGTWGGIIMGFFGAVFASLTLALQFGWHGLPVGVPFAGFVAITLAAIVVIRRPGGRIARSRQGRRVVVWSTVGEGVGLFLAANLVINLGHPEFLLPATAFVVGLHFLPMGYGIPFRPFYWLGGVLLSAGAIGFAVGGTAGGTIAGLVAAASLWMAALLAVRREAEARTG